MAMCLLDKWIKHPINCDALHYLDFDASIQLINIVHCDKIQGSNSHTYILYLNLIEYKNNTHEKLKFWINSLSQIRYKLIFTIGNTFTGLVFFTWRDKIISFGNFPWLKYRLLQNTQDFIIEKRDEDVNVLMYYQKKSKENCFHHPFYSLLPNDL